MGDSIMERPKTRIIQKMIVWIKNNKLPVFAVGLAVILRIATPQWIILGGEDVLDTWINAKKILYGMDYFLIHNSARFGTIIPVYITQLIFGTSPLVYYIAPAVFQVITVFFLFRLSEMVLGRKFALVVCALFLVFPDSLIAGSHPRTSTFSMMFLVIAIFYIMKFIRSEDRTVNGSLVLSGVFLFLMYLSNEVTVFFFPGIALSLIISKKSIKPVLSLFGIFSFFFLCETLLYSVFTPYSFGRLQIAAQKHLGEGGNLVPVQSFIDLLGRFSPSSASYWSLFIPLFLVSSVYLVRNKYRSALRYYVLIGLSFILFITITIKGLTPIIPVVNFRSRYLSDLSPLLIPVLAGAVYYLLLSLKKDFWEKVSGRRVHIYAAIAVIVAGIIINSVVYTKKNYGHYNYLKVYPIVSLHRSYTCLNDEYASGVPIVVKGKHVPNKQVDSMLKSVRDQLDKGADLNEALSRAKVTPEAYLKLNIRKERIFFTEGKIFEEVMFDERRHSSGGEIRIAEPELFYMGKSEYHLYSKKPIPEKKDLYPLPYVIDLINKPFGYRKVPFSEIDNAGEIE